MKRITIHRVGFERSIYERIKHLIPKGIPVALITEDEHLSRLSNLPQAEDDQAFAQSLDDIRKLCQRTDGRIFEVIEPKPCSARITIQFADSGNIDEAWIFALQKIVRHGIEVYIGSKKFDFGVFVIAGKVDVWDSSYD